LRAGSLVLHDRNAFTAEFAEVTQIDAEKATNAEFLTVNDEPGIYKWTTSNFNIHHSVFYILNLYSSDSAFPEPSLRSQRLNAFNAEMLSSRRRRGEINPPDTE
jgi:hypothetical protein